MGNQIWSINSAKYSEMCTFYTPAGNLTFHVNVIKINNGRKIKRVYIQSYNPGVLRKGFLRLLLRLQLRSLSRGFPSSHLVKDERLILAHTCLFMKASRVVLRGVWFREEPLT